MLKRLKTAEERETYLLELIESEFSKAKLMQLVKKACGLTEQHLEAIMTKLDATVLTRGMSVTSTMSLQWPIGSTRMSP